ncbi:Transglutaminase-like superfamily protein [Aquimixticola soesokkakensis]|uniref:Transglutaminase-like superfamily protein n=1 Tax=Aquimixticola soesokkakensis TaxID=1519096 RepID=A0A1Y5SC36_9RHOB|nr:transglutaminase family protein [Aquimixticola soesokkakensis]SLN37361.1 Transglutaminase-like superfamily protein [Aquimixticola soesokkakensis]
MLYDIRAEITYSYAVPAHSTRQVLRLVPADLDGRQRLISWSLESAPHPQERDHGFDFFGNRTVLLRQNDPHSKLHLVMRARVERFSEPLGLDISPPFDGLMREIASYRSIAPQSPHHFLGASPRLALEAPITAYARALLRPTDTVLSYLKRLTAAVHADMSFDATATSVETPPLEAFEKRHGVCQDFSQITIAALRGLGIPAGYVSGYLRTLPPPGEKKLDGVDAMHAWVMAWCGLDMGWIAVDPTNNMVAGSDHVVVGVGRDYDDVSPVRGVSRFAGSHTTKQIVDVRQVRDHAPA